MVFGNAVSNRAFTLVNTLFLIGVALLCLLPLVHILAVSFSKSSAAAAGIVGLWPVDFTLHSYRFILKKPEFLQSINVTLVRVVIGTTLSMLLTILAAYPLSKEARSLKFRTFYAWFFVFTMLFGGGLIPWYMTIKYLGLLDSVWGLILPSALPVYNVILLLNFFRALPRELEESALMDGAGYWKTLWAVYVPLSKPALATVGLFTLVGNWNAWFDGLILMNSPSNYPLASYLQTVIRGVDLTKLTGQDVLTMASVNDRTAKAAQIFVGTVPILLVYPFLQKYFVKGIVLGSVKE